MIDLLIAQENPLTEEQTAKLYQAFQAIADSTGQDVRVVAARGLRLNSVLRESEADSKKFESVLFVPAPAVSSAPMTSAEFLWRPDGKPDWGSMWQGFCELALYGGPPHRGEDSALKASLEQIGNSETQIDAIAEIRRGIWETTGLYAEPAGEGWIGVTCDSPKMAAWLCASIILENVEARLDGELLLLPASPAFKLKDEVKSVITVLAKTHHYWQQHARK